MLAQSVPVADPEYVVVSPQLDLVSATSVPCAGVSSSCSNLTVSTIKVSVFILLQSHSVNNKG